MLLLPILLVMKSEMAIKLKVFLLFTRVVVAQEVENILSMLPLFAMLLSVILLQYLFQSHPRILTHATQYSLTNLKQDVQFLA
jgi:hypothetical protein